MQVADLFYTTQQLFGGVDVVVRTAGIITLSPLTDFSLNGKDQASIDRLANIAPLQRLVRRVSSAIRAAKRP